MAARLLLEPGQSNAYALSITPIDDVTAPAACFERTITDYRCLGRPCRYPVLSRIAVNDLLQANGYDAANAKVDVTEVPYRTI
jgi:hypothetical protein